MFLVASLSAEDVSLIKDSKLRGYVETGRQGIFSGGAAAREGRGIFREARNDKLKIRILRWARE
jgi:hypothetical protein